MSRSLPDLEVVAESSIMSILRWSFKTNMEKAMSSYDNGLITMVHIFLQEVVFIGILFSIHASKFSFEGNGSTI